MRFHVGSDHAGVELRTHLVGVLRDLGHEIASETGASSADDRCDYPDVAMEICGRIGRDPGAFGLLVCGSGQGMAMTANRIAGIRAAVCADVFSARMARAHNDANVLCLGQRVLGVGVATSILEAFLGVEFEGGRHELRVAKLDGSGG